MTHINNSNQLTDLFGTAMTLSEFQHSDPASIKSRMEDSYELQVLLEEPFDPEYISCQSGCSFEEAEEFLKAKSLSVEHLPFT